MSGAAHLPPPVRGTHPAGPARLEIRSLSKTFGPARVLTDVALTVAPGELHGLAGQNGSGKSTLIKILTGVHGPDSGAEYLVDGQAIRLPVRWDEVHAAGVSVVHQDLGLLDQLSVADNICVGGYPRSPRSRRIDARRRDLLTRRTLDRLGVQLDPGRLVGSLSAPERAEVAIARALRDHAPRGGLIILDESTRALTGGDLDRVHQMLRRLTAEGSSALLISHNLAELIAVTDRITILRDGCVAGAGLVTGDLTEAEVARRMLGSSVGVVDAHRRGAPGDRPRSISVTGLRGGRVRDVDFALAPGEVLGMTGLPGSGYEDIPYLVTGALPATAGELRLGTDVIALPRSGVRGSLRAGVVLVPERRDRDGLAMAANVRDNISLPRVRARGSRWFVSRRWQHDDAVAAAARLDIRPRSPTMLVKELSGGNQQKVLLGKWLGVGPRLLVLHEPTQAVDVGARRDILQALRGAADSGVAVLLVTSEPDDLSVTCDRVLLYRDGRGLSEVSGTSDALISAVYAPPSDAGGPGR